MKKPRRPKPRSPQRRPQKPVAAAPEPGLLAAEAPPAPPPLPPIAPPVQEAPPPPLPADAVDVELPPDSALDPMMLQSGAVEMPQADGSVIIDLNPAPAPLETKDHLDNIAELLDDITRGRIANEVCEGIEADDQSRQQWLQDRQDGIDLLGLKVEKPKASPGQDGPVSSVRHPLLLEAVLRFQANARGELLPSSGPVKVRNDDVDTAETDAQARQLEESLNHYLTTTATEYYPDTDRMLFWVGFGGQMFKKVYTCPIRRRPVSESVDAKDLIVSNTATDLRNCERVTHRITMRRSVMKRMQLIGVYRNVDLGQPTPEPDAVDRKIALVQGTQAEPQRPDDAPYEIWECYCELDIPGFEHRDEFGEVTGLPLPYRVTIERNSREVLEIRRNWREGDDQFQAKIPFVSYQFGTGLGFYGTGLLHILGNTTQAVTGAWRMFLDNTMFANFPGFIYASSGTARQKKQDIRVGPGEGAAVETGGADIRQVVMPLPYKEAGPASIQFIDGVAQTGQRVGGTAEMQVGEGKQDAPVGTTLALIEQAQKVMSAVHKRLHAAQAEEFRLLKEEFMADPEALWRNNRRAQRLFNVPQAPQQAQMDMIAQQQLELARQQARKRLVQALDNLELVPHADPNTPSHMHRIMKVLGLKQLAQGNPMYNQQAVDLAVLEALDYEDPQRFFLPPAPPQAPPVDPIAATLAQAEMIKAQAKAKDTEIKGMAEAAKALNAAKDRELKQNIAVLDLAKELALHPESDPVVDRQLREMKPFLSPKGKSQSAARPPPLLRPGNLSGRAPPLPGLGGGLR